MCFREKALVSNVNFNCFFCSARVVDLPALLELSSLFHWDFIGTTECNRVQACGEAEEYHQWDS